MAWRGYRAGAGRHGTGQHRLRCVNASGRYSRCGMRPAPSMAGAPLIPSAPRRRVNHRGADARQRPDCPQCRVPHRTRQASRHLGSAVTHRSLDRRDATNLRPRAGLAKMRERQHRSRWWEHNRPARNRVRSGQPWSTCGRWGRASSARRTPPDHRQLDLRRRFPPADSGTWRSCAASTATPRSTASTPAGRRRIPGVIAVYTGAGLPGFTGPMPLRGGEGGGAAVRPRSRRYPGDRRGVATSGRRSPSSWRPTATCARRARPDRGRLRAAAGRHRHGGGDPGPARRSSTTKCRTISPTSGRQGGRSRRGVRRGARWSLRAR